MRSPSVSSLRATVVAHHMYLSYKASVLYPDDNNRCNSTLITLYNISCTIRGLSVCMRQFPYVEIHVDMIPTLLTVSLTSTRAFKYNNKHQSK